MIVELTIRGEKRDRYEAYLSIARGEQNVTLDGRRYAAVEGRIDDDLSGITIWMRLAPVDCGACTHCGKEIPGSRADDRLLLCAACYKSGRQPRKEKPPRWREEPSARPEFQSGGIVYAPHATLAGSLTDERLRSLVLESLAAVAPVPRVQIPPDGDVEIPCECGAAKTGETHADYCPIAKIRAALR